MKCAVVYLSEKYFLYYVIYWQILILSYFDLFMRGISFMKTILLVWCFSYEIYHINVLKPSWGFPAATRLWRVNLIFYLYLECTKWSCTACTYYNYARSDLLISAHPLENFLQKNKFTCLLTDFRN